MVLDDPVRSYSLLLKEGSGFCNSLRRIMHSEIDSWAPGSCEIRKNTTCHTDEMLAHRIGMVPFFRSGNGEEIMLKKRGPCICYSSDFQGHSFTPISGTIPLFSIDEGSEIDMTLYFEFGNGSKHARFSPVSGIGMKKVQEDEHVITFSSINGTSGKEIVLESLLKLEKRVDKALLSLSNNQIY
jgi:DNA-directed RNA polymerase alpha subunit